MTTVARMDVIIGAQVDEALSGFARVNTAVAQTTDKAGKDLQKFGVFAKEAGNELGLGIGRGAIQAGNALNEGVVALQAYVVQLRATTAGTSAMSVAQVAAAATTRVLNAALSAFGGPIGVAVIGTLFAIDKLLGSQEAKTKAVEAATNANIKAQTKAADSIREGTRATQDMARELENVQRQQAAFAMGGERALNTEKDRQKAFEEAREQYFRVNGSLVAVSDATLKADESFKAMLATTLQTITAERKLEESVKASEEAQKKAKKAAEELAEARKKALAVDFDDQPMVKFEQSWQRNVNGPIEELPPLVEDVGDAIEFTFGERVTLALVEVNRLLADMRITWGDIGIEIARAFSDGAGVAMGSVVNAFTNPGTFLLDWIGGFTDGILHGGRRFREATRVWMDTFDEMQESLDEQIAELLGDRAKVLDIRLGDKIEEALDQLGDLPVPAGPMRNLWEGIVNGLTGTLADRATVNQLLQSNIPEFMKQALREYLESLDKIAQWYELSKQKLDENTAAQERNTSAQEENTSATDESTKKVKNWTGTVQEATDTIVESIAGIIDLAGGFPTFTGGKPGGPRKLSDVGGFGIDPIVIDDTFGGGGTGGGSAGGAGGGGGGGSSVAETASRIATATVEQENRLIGIQTTALSVLRRIERHVGATARAAAQDLANSVALSSYHAGDAFA